MPEHHAKNVPRGNKTTLRDPDSCEEAQGSFRTSLESTTASSRLEGFTASSGSEKAQRHYVEQTVGQNEKPKKANGGYRRLFPEREFGNQWLHESQHPSSLSYGPM